MRCSNTAISSRPSRSLARLATTKETSSALLWRQCSTIQKPSPRLCGLRRIGLASQVLTALHFAIRLSNALRTLSTLKAGRLNSHQTTTAISIITAGRGPRTGKNILKSDGTNPTTTFPQAYLISSKTKHQRNNRGSPPLPPGEDFLRTLRVAHSPPNIGGEW